MASLDAMGIASRKDPSQKKGRQLHFQHSHRVGERLWKTAESEIKADMRHNRGHMFEDSWQDHLAAVSMKTQVTGAHRVTVDKKCDATNAYNPGGFSSSSIDKALESIMTSSRTPNCKQGQLLRHFVERLKLEYLEHHLGKINQGLGEPLLDVVHGSPGSGKSAVIR